MIPLLRTLILQMSTHTRRIGVTMLYSVSLHISSMLTTSVCPAHYRYLGLDAVKKPQTGYEPGGSKLQALGM